MVSDLKNGFLAISLFCTGANQEQLLAAKALAAPGVSVKPGRPRFDNIFRYDSNCSRLIGSATCDHHFAQER
jgi:hypothetical protein